MCVFYYYNFEIFFFCCCLLSNNFDLDLENMLKMSVNTEWK